MMYSPHRNGNRITGANIHNTKQHSQSMSTLSLTLWYKLAAEHSGFVGEIHSLVSSALSLTVHKMHTCSVLLHKLS